MRDEVPFSAYPFYKHAGGGGEGDDIREDIVINFPTRLLCSEACKGLCPSCGADLNNNSCDCSTEDSFPGIWDDLDRLKK